MTLRARHAVLILLGVGGLLLAPLPTSGRITHAALDYCHVGVGGLLALAIWIVLRPRVRLGDALLAYGVFLGATGLGLAIEKVQGLTGRDASWVDAGTNGVGAAVMLLLVLYARGRARPLWVTGAVITALLLLAAWLPGRQVYDALRQRSALPMLASFEDELELSRWRFQEAAGHIVQTHGTHGPESLRVEFAPGEYPGANFVWPSPDWSAHAAFAFDIHVDEGAPLPLIVKIEDRAHNQQYEDRFHEELLLEPGTHQIRIETSKIRDGIRGRKLDLEQVAVVQLFLDGLKDARVIHIDNVRLLKD
ncbi:MAG: hypothetical protein GY946_27390 [bacterium]|nr:hypothetical protein [bacterium]